MPVTDQIANFLGRLGGFNKYVADEITLTEINGGWKGTTVHDGSVRIALEFTPDATVDISALAEVKGTVYQYAPAGLDLYLNRITLVPVVPPIYQYEPGRVRITIDPEAPWAGLFHEEAEGIGVLETFEGGNNMRLEQVHWAKRRQKISMLW
jgi:hypothetical protein